MKAQNQPPFLFPDSGQATEAEISWFYSRAELPRGGLCVQDSNFSFGLIFIFYTQPSGSGVNQVDVQAMVLDLGINALCVFPQHYLAFCFFTPFKAKEA